MSAEPGLPLRTRVLYASQSLGGEAITQSRGLWLVFFYAPPADAERDAILPLGLVGALLFAGRLLEAFDDPLIGWWSDRTRSRWGRRLPFVLLATPPWGLFSVLIFVPPPTEETAAAALYLFVVLELFLLFATLSGTPYESLFPEIARTSDDRLSIVGIRVYFGAAGGFAGVVLSGLIVDHLGFQAMALTMAMLGVVTRYAGMLAVWRRASPTGQPAALGLRAALAETLRNRQFLHFLPSFVLFQTGLQMVLGLLPFLVVAVLGGERGGTWISILTAVAFGTAIAVVPLVLRYARRTSKRQAYGRALLGAALAFPLVAFAGFVPMVPSEVQVVAVLAVVGAPMAAVFLFPAALTADIADYDETRTGMRREAMYFGTQAFVEKTATAAAPVLLTTILLLGNTADDPLGVRLVGPVAGMLVFLGYVAFRGYELPDEVSSPES